MQYDTYGMLYPFRQIFVLNTFTFEVLKRQSLHQEFQRYRWSIDKAQQTKGLIHRMVLIGVFNGKLSDVDFIRKFISQPISTLKVKLKVI